MENELQREPATPEEIWAILREVSKEQRKLSRQQKQTDRQMKQTDRQMKKLAGLFTSQWGALMESLVEGDLVPLLQARGITVRYTHTRMRGRRNGEHYEFDILAENGEEVVVVEVKTTLRAEDVAQFLEKLGKFKVYAPGYQGKKIYGAVAYIKADTSVQVHAERQGLYVIRATGNSASIINTEDFRPRVFGS